MLTGDANPGGKLPISIPRHVGQVPVYVPPPPDRRPLAAEGRLRRRADRRRCGRSGSGCRTRRSSVDDLRARPDRGGDRRRRGRGQRRRRRTPATAPGDEVVQLYVRDEEATVARPVRELRGFRRVSLAAGRAPDGHVPAVGRAVRLHRRGLPARHRAGHDRRSRSGRRRPTCRSPRRSRSSARRSSSSSATATSPRPRLADARAVIDPTARSGSSTSGSSGPSSSTWAGRSTAGSTSRATRRPMPTAGAATSLELVADLGVTSSVIRAATSSRATTGRTASVRARRARPGWIWPGARSSPTSSGRTSSSPGRALVGARADARGQPRHARRSTRPATSSSTATRRPARGWPTGGRPTVTLSRMASGRGASATRWTARGRSARRPRSSTAGWRPRPARSMRLVDPSIELVTCGSSGSKMPTFGAWEETVLDLAWDVTDHVSLHCYFDRPHYASTRWLSRLLARARPDDRDRRRHRRRGRRAARPTTGGSA